jgi:hypothetical protein
MALLSETYSDSAGAFKRRTTKGSLRFEVPAEKR